MKDQSKITPLPTPDLPGNLTTLLTIIDGKDQYQPYKSSFLQNQDGVESSSLDFLKEISEKVELTDLYQILDSCYCNQKMTYCPIQVEIKQDYLKKQYECKYLLQVWDTEGRKIFQKKMSDPIKIWSIQEEYFIFKPEGDDTYANYYHITNLKKDNATMLLLDFLMDKSYTNLLYYQDVLYISNKEKIHLLHVEDTLQKGEVQTIDVEKVKKQKLVPGQPIHAIFMIDEPDDLKNLSTEVIVVMETCDNQLDFSSFTFENLDSTAFSFEFIQRREVVKRDVRADDVKKFAYIIDESGTLYGVTQRQSGGVDLYWNMNFIESPQNVEAEDINLSFDTFYFQLRDKDGNVTIRGLDTDQKSQINYDQSRVQPGHYQFHLIFYQNIKNQVNLFNSFILINNTLYVVHGPFISLYDIQEKQWQRHLQFEEGDILKMIKIIKKDDNTEKIEITIVLESGSIYCNLKKLLDRTEFANNKILQGQRTLNIESKIISITWDKVNSEYIFILSQYDEKNFNLNVINDNKLYDVFFDESQTEGLKYPINRNTNFVPIQQQSKVSKYMKTEQRDDQNFYFIAQSGKNFTIYDMQIKKINQVAQVIDDDEEIEKFEMIQSSGDNLDGGMKSIKDGQEEESEERVILHTVCDGVIDDLRGSLHSCISLNIRNHVFLIDQYNIYKYNLPTKKFKTFNDQLCQGVQVIDGSYCYAMSHSTITKSSGMRLYDLNYLMKEINDTFILLDRIQVGFNGYIDWNSEHSRLSFLQSFNTLNIVPAMHRNTIAFMGMGKRESFLATKVIHDKFIAVDNQNNIFCWSTLTGKLLSNNRLPHGQDYSSYQVYQNLKDNSDDIEYKREWYSKILLTKSIPEKKDDQKYQTLTDNSRNTIRNQQSFESSLVKEFKEFILIEIKSEAEVIEHFRFIHPAYLGQPQKIYFNNTNSYMLERLTHPRVFLYVKEPNRDGSNFVHWQLHKRFNGFPEDLENDTGFLRVMSPCFEHYIDLNKEEGVFVIKDTLNQQTISKFPSDLLDIKKESVKQIMNRFNWVDSQQVRIISKEGIEKLLDINNLNEIEYNVIPLFKNDELKKQNRHYFTNRKELKINDLLQRLQRKYQYYKSSYFLEHKKEPNALYSKMFTVDYQQNGCKGMHLIDLSFTFFHWRIIEELRDQRVQVSDIDEEQIELICFNLLPYGETVLHKLDTEELISKIYKISHSDEEFMKLYKFEIPFLPNFDGFSPLHKCKQRQDIRSMNTMLQFLSGYHIDHHSRAMVDLIPFVIGKQMPALLPYLESRILSTQQSQGITKLVLKEKSNGITEIPLWFDWATFKKKLLKDDSQEDIERPIRVEFLDIPKLFNFNDSLFLEFFVNLAATKQYEIFEKKSVKTVIDFNYHMVKNNMVKKLFRPFILFQITFFIYLNVVFQQEGFVSYFDLPMQIVLGFYSMYFLNNQRTIFQNEGWGYFALFWHYVDIVTPTTITTVLLINTLEIDMDDDFERALQAIGVFFMWFKLLYFFRMFESYGFFIRLILEVVADMSTFMIVFILTIVAFSDSLLTISNGNTVDEQFVTDYLDSIIYTYRIILGDINVDEFGSVGVPLIYILFILCTVFNTIVMLNLLIAIISETYDRVKANRVNQGFQEKAAMIAENAYLVPPKARIEYAEENRVLMVITDLEQEENDQDEEEETVRVVDYLKKKISMKYIGINQEFNSLKQIVFREINRAGEMNKNKLIELKHKISADLKNAGNQLVPNSKLHQALTKKFTAQMDPKNKAQSFKIENLLSGIKKKEGDTKEFNFSQV